MASPIKLKLPATSANLGPGFDALGLAMDFALHIEAREAAEGEGFSIKASGRNAAQTGDVADSLVLETYKSVLTGQGIDPMPLHLDLNNEIPLGMGCGSSAAALVAGVALASHFGGLGWTREQVLTEASLREGHPDNVAACVLGGLTVSSMLTPDDGPPIIDALSITPPVRWPLLVVMPDASLSTKKARALLPESYSKADAIANVQRVSMLTAAFAQGRGDLLARAMDDRMHQPYRSAACPLLPKLLPLAGHHGILGVALSGAGPSVLLILRSVADFEQAKNAVEECLTSGERLAGVVLPTEVALGAKIS
ncbi:homoserine kinase [Terriglobus roseus DSM 18391]|uniref:Homoserine kinase n=1 Tax=Terriglobus roseus (strain DSM 18391 / NRRL B-41598 / KBS 63) TaxID=926566 RepID=I3ZJL2_TERRK|nr:homoserine kinase [Terriglobus roseus]AFL89430.1 homoserine kinase [Terriglobus roseus DSM 18391]